VVARLDADAQLAGLDALKGELERLRKELGSVEATTKESQSSRVITQYAEARQLALDIERLRLVILDRQSLLEQDRIEVKRLIEQVEANKGLVEKGIVPRLTLVELQLRRDVITQRIAENEKGLKEAEKQKTSCEVRLKGIAQAQLADLPTVLAPIRASIAAQEARIHQLQLQIQELEVKSPIDGIVSAILCYPGQAVRIGVPIITIAAGQARYVVSYVRQEQRMKPAPGMPVDVTLRTTPVRRIPAVIDAVGGQVEPVPAHHLRDPKLPEWGLPVRIALPAGTDLHPGELVDITFKPLPAAAAAGVTVREEGL
jgi:multidrug resistance efflux pump